MISPHTPPGTMLMVVWTASSVEDLVRVLVPEARGRLLSKYGEGRARLTHSLRVGQRVRLVQIIPNIGAATGFAALVEGSPGESPLEMFRVAELPGCLTEVLTRTPKKTEEMTK